MVGKKEKDDEIRKVRDLTQRDNLGGPSNGKQRQMLDALAEEPQSRWEELPVLEEVCNLLGPKEWAACACVCKRWREEAERDHRWQEAWGSGVSHQGLWRWARAEGGYRRQLQARALVRKGDCVASTFPFNRRDGTVSEVLLLDALPEAYIVTIQVRRLLPSVVRLQGATVKVWSASALGAQRPLLLVHDVVKHMQLEDGRLFMWRIRGDAIIAMRSLDDNNASQVAESSRWTEHPSLTASVLDPAALAVTDVPLDSAYGRGKAPFEWMDMANGCVASAQALVSEQRVAVRVFDLGSGLCLCQSSVAMPPAPHDVAQLQDDTALMLLSRNSDARHQMVAAAALFDCRVFCWRIHDRWLLPEAREKMVEFVVLKRRLEQSSKELAESVAAVQAAAEQALAEGPSALAQDVASHLHFVEERFAELNVKMHQLEATIDGLQQGQFALHHVFTTVDVEPIVDLSISTAARRIYVCGMETIFVLGIDGTPQLACSMVHWRGVRSHFPFADHGPVDVGAFSWPMPNSSKAAFYLDATNALFLVEFRPSQLQEVWQWANPLANAEVPGRFPPIDHHMAHSLGPGAADTTLFVQSHTDLRPPPRALSPHPLSTRAQRMTDTEQVIVEYIQSGETLFAGADASCTSVASLLRAERSAGTYLAGLGPAAVAAHAAVGGGGGRGGRGPVLSMQGRGGGAAAPLAPRALVCIDAATGRQYKAIPIEGALEAVHSAGKYLVMAVAPLEGYPDGAGGALTVVDFSQVGFGLTPAQRQAQKAAAEEKGQRLRKGKQAAAAADEAGPSQRRKRGSKAARG